MGGPPDLECGWGEGYDTQVLLGIGSAGGLGSAYECVAVLVIIAAPVTGSSKGAGLPMG